MLCCPPSPFVHRTVNRQEPRRQAVPKGSQLATSKLVDADAEVVKLLHVPAVGGVVRTNQQVEVRRHLHTLRDGVSILHLYH